MLFWLLLFLEHKIEPLQMAKWEWTTTGLQIYNSLLFHEYWNSFNTAYHFDRHVRVLSQTWLRTFVREFSLIGKLLIFSLKSGRIKVNYVAWKSNTFYLHTDSIDQIMTSYMWRPDVKIGNMLHYLHCKILYLEQYRNLKCISTNEYT